MPTVELKAPAGLFRTIGVDTFDGGDWVYGDYETLDEAIKVADLKGGQMLKTHVYNDKGKHLHGAGTY